MGQLTNRAASYALSVLELSAKSNGWMDGDCPFCGRRQKFGVNLAKNYYHCYNESCGAKGTIYNLAQHLSGKEGDELKDFLASYPEHDQEVGASNLLASRVSSAVKSSVLSKIALPQGYRVAGDYSGSYIGDRLERYLESRGISTEYAASVGIGYCDNPKDPFHSRMIIPMYRQGVLVYYQGRALFSEVPKYLNSSAAQGATTGPGSILYNEDCLKYVSKVYAVEGVFCALTGGSDWVAYLGGSLSPAQVSTLIKSEAREVVIVPDKGFYDSVLPAAAKIFLHKKVKVLDLNRIESLPLGSKDVNEIGLEKVLELEERTLPFNYGDLTSRHKL